MGYDLKYKGAKIDELLDKAGTALQEHQDISHLATKTEVNAKVDKVTGKQLSTEDFTPVLRSKLGILNMYAVDTDEGIEEPEFAGSESNEWKSVFDGKLSVGATGANFTTYADGTPLQAKEIMVQIIYEEASTRASGGYVYVQSTTNKKTTLYGPFNYEEKSNNALTQIHLTASPLLYMIADIKKATYQVGTPGTAFSSGGGLTNRFEIYEDFVKVGLHINQPCEVPPYVKIIAR